MQAGVAGEIDDRFTSFTAPQLAAMRFEGGKLMYRLDPQDPLSIKAIEDCALAINDLPLGAFGKTLADWARGQNKGDGSTDIAFTEDRGARFAAYGRSTYPDATFTLRLAYGKVAGYVQNGKKIPFYTTIGGAFDYAAKHDNKPPYKLPDSWMNASPDASRWREGRVRSAEASLVPTMRVPLFFTMS